MANNIVYKYRTNNKYALNILTKGELWFAEPNTFNDPFDCKVEYKNLTPKEEREYINKVFERKGVRTVLEISDEKIHEAVLKVVNNDESPLRVLSLSEDELNILMWSHYADNHKGFCIGFKTYSHKNAFDTNFIKIEDGQIKDNILAEYGIPDNWLPLGKVVYDDTMPKERNLNSDYENDLEKFFIQKSSLWKYEKEKRVLLWKDILLKQNIPIKINKNEIAEIIFGLKMKKELKDNIIHIVSNYEVKPKIYECKSVKGKYSIIKEEISY